MSSDEMLRRGSRGAMRAFRAATLAAAEAELAEAYPAAVAAAHAPLALAVPAEHAARFRGRYGVDPAALYGLSPAGLPTNACCLLGCPLFLVPLGAPRPGGGMHPRLRAHLAPVGVVPGLHKTVQQVPLPRAVSDRGAFLRRAPAAARNGGARAAGPGRGRAGRRRGAGPDGGLG